MLRYFRTFTAPELKTEGKKQLMWTETLQWSEDGGKTWNEVPRVVDDEGLAQKQKEVEDADKKVRDRQ